MSAKLSICGYLDYYSAKELANKARTSLGYGIGCNTYVRHSGDDVEVIYHATPVITFHPDDKITLRTNGWYTPTTKLRFSLLSCAGRLGSYRGHWFWGSVPFYEGMQVDRTGTLVSPAPQSYLDAWAFAKRQIGEAGEGVARLMADPVFRAKVRLGALAPNMGRNTSTILAGKLTPRAIEELALRDVDLSGYAPSITQRQLERMIRKGAL